VAVLGWNSGATRAGVVREELGELPSGEAELMRPCPGLGCSRAAGPRRSRRLGTAEQAGGGATVRVAAAG
jgi:hypothetical protein